MTLAFDTHKSVKSLQEAGFNEKQAEAQVGIIAEIFEEQEKVYKSNLANKQDLLKLETVLRQDINDVETVLRQESSDIKSELKQDIHALDNKVKSVEADVQLLKWMMGFLLAGMLALLSKLFFV